MGKHNVPASVPEVGTADFSEFQKEVTPKEYNGMYYFEKQNISMRLLYSYDSRTVLQLVSPKSWSVTYSPFSYAYDAMSKSNNTDLINLLNSMYWYGRAVYDYRAY